METHQSKLHAALYSGLKDTIHYSDANVDVDDMCHCVILPSSYIGGPRYMNQCFQDAMAMA